MSVCTLRVPHRFISQSLLVSLSPHRGVETTIRVPSTLTLVIDLSSTATCMPFRVPRNYMPDSPINVSSINGAPKYQKTIKSQSRATITQLYTFDLHYQPCAVMVVSSMRVRLIQIAPMRDHVPSFVSSWKKSDNSFQDGVRHVQLPSSPKAARILH
jgi:hypothetical protein